MDLLDLDILDLCAGTGNISLEFLSREAGFVTSVDKHPVCIRYMYKLLTELGIGEEWQISKNDVLQFVERTPATYDLIFADPPYDAPFHAQLMRTIIERGLINPGGMAVIEHGRQTDLSEIPGFLEMRRFGNVHFSFFHRLEMHVV